MREAGAVPATVALLDGRIRVGLDDADAGAPRHRRRRGQVLAPRPGTGPGAGGLGATTVAGTILVAARLGIRLMATGGIGGVHRGGEVSLDVSADLHELRRSGVAVVCSGAKIILDLPRTLEVLETLGVPVLGYGTADFPAFYLTASGLPVPRVDGLDGLAAAIAAQAALGWPTGMVVANPPPAELALDPAELEAALARALADARAPGRARQGRDALPPRPPRRGQRRPLGRRSTRRWWSPTPAWPPAPRLCFRGRTIAS